jgi:hypothetical protein
MPRMLNKYRIEKGSYSYMQNIPAHNGSSF